MIARTMNPQCMEDRHEKEMSIKEGIFIRMDDKAPLLPRIINYSLQVTMPRAAAKIFDQ